MGSSAAWGRRWTLPLVTAAALLESADESLLPAMYTEVGAALGASPTALGSITLCRALVQALCYPLAACAAAWLDRARVVAAGTFLCAAAAALVGASSTVPQMAAARGFNGVGLALVLPAAYSLVADGNDDASRGAAFGWVFMASGVGGAMGASLGVLLAPASFLGVPGWRLAFQAVALVSAGLAALTWLLAADDRSPASTTKTKGSMPTVAAEAVRDARAVVRVPTFWVVVAQGAAAQVPWQALAFMAMWLELVGLSHWETTVVTGLNLLSNGLGALLAGFAGDLAARRFPDAGRVAMAQASNAAAVPLAALLLLLVRPGWPLAGAVYAGGFLLLGVAMAWSTVSTSNPILAEVVPEKARTAVYALDMCFENVVASFGAPVVGILAERVFGYRPQAAASDRENAAALGKALFTGIAVPATICCLTYSALYWTYPADRRRARMMAAAAAPSVDGGKNCDCEASGPAPHDGLNQALLSVTATK
ncbi:unnamed protein product [Urochloa decumbens]|uniref:Major facilitator superfamily (MFS) profile domain-containing protein n=1 Tax=Urochloa decumbens TaxID=240449 RepID=A0ABC9FQP2_9POAL